MNKRQLVHALFRGAGLFIIFNFCATLSRMALEDDTLTYYVMGFWTARLPSQVNAVYAVIMFFSISAILTLHHDAMQEAYDQRHKSISAISFLLCYPYLYVQLSAFSVCVLLFPMSAPYYDLAYGYLSGIPSSMLVRCYVAAAIALPVLWATHIASCLSVLRRHRQRQRSKPTRKTLAFLGRLIGTVALFYLCSVCLIIVIPMLVTVARVFVLVWQSGLIFLLLALGLIAFAMLSLRTSWARRKVLKGLRRIAFQHHGSLSYHQETGLWELRTPQTIFVIRFLASPKKRSALYLHENGMLSQRKDFILMKHYVSVPYTFEASEEAKKILLICPCRGPVIATASETVPEDARHIQWLKPRKTDIPKHSDRHVEAGDRMHEYTVYHAKSFLSMLERIS